MAPGPGSACPLPDGLAATDCAPLGANVADGSVCIVKPSPLMRNTIVERRDCLRAPGTGSGNYVPACGGWRDGGGDGDVTAAEQEDDTYRREEIAAVGMAARGAAGAS